MLSDCVDKGRYRSVVRGVKGSKWRRRAFEDSLVASDECCFLSHGSAGRSPSMIIPSFPVRSVAMKGLLRDACSSFSSDKRIHK